MGKEEFGILLQYTGLWSLPFTVALSIIAAKEGTEDLFPKKTIIACAVYIALIGILHVGYHC